MKKRTSADSPTTVDTADAESYINKESYDWETFKSRSKCKCMSFVLQLVLVGSLGSFLFGFNLALLNTATKAINSSFLQCGPDGIGAWAKFQGKDYGNNFSFINKFIM